MTWLDADDAYENARAERWKEPPSERRVQLAAGAIPEADHDEATTCRLDDPESRELRRKATCEREGLPYHWPRPWDLRRAVDGTRYRHMNLNDENLEDAA